FQSPLRDEISDQLRTAEKCRTAAQRDSARQTLHHLADRLRFYYGVDHLSAQEAQHLDLACREIWDNRQKIALSLGQSVQPALQSGWREDLLDVALFRARLMNRAGDEQAQALALLAEAEALLGSNP